MTDITNKDPKTNKDPERTHDMDSKVTRPAQNKRARSLVEQWGRLWTEWDRTDQWAGFELGDLTTVDEIIEWLHCVGQQFLISNVRYYRRSPRGLSLVGSAGHSKAVKDRLQAVRREERMDTRESFHCFDAGKPVICAVDLDLTIVHEEDDLTEMIASARVPSSCDVILQTRGPRLYLDVPVYFDGESVSKFSCDFCVADGRLLDIQGVERFCVFAWWAGHVLHAKHLQDPCKQDRVERARIMKLKTRRDIFNYVEQKLPIRFNCRSATFFELRSDTVSGGDVRKILAPLTARRKTCLEHFGYSYGDNEPRFLIPATAITKKTIVLSNVESERLRDEECQEIGLDVNWKDPHFDDWKGVGSLMLIPVRNPASESDDVFGVLMLSGKRPAGKEDFACFNSLDRRLAQRLVDESIAPRIEAIRNLSREQWEKLPFSRKDMEELRSSGDKSAEVAVRLLRRAIPQRRTKKLYAVCKVDVAEERLAVLASDGRLDKKNSRRIGIPAKGTVTFAAVQEPQDNVIYRNVENDSREYATPGAVCEIACAVTGRAGLRAALIVKSDNYDLSLEEHGLYLKTLASWVGDVLHDKLGD